MLRTPNGFSLIEVLVAMLILSVGITALASAMFSIPLLMEEAGRDNQVSVLGSGELERLRALPCDRLASGERPLGSRSVAWTVRPAAGGLVELAVVVRSETRRRSWADTLVTTTTCR